MGSKTQDADRWNQRTCVQPSILSSDAISAQCKPSHCPWMEPVYSGHPSGPNQLPAIQRWPDYTVEPVYSGHPSTSCLLYGGGLIIQWNLCILATPQDLTSWLLYRGGLIIQWNLCIASGPKRWPDYTVYSRHIHTHLCILVGWPLFTSCTV